MAPPVLLRGATIAGVSERSTIDSVPRGEYVPTADQRLVMYGVSWERFEAFIELRGLDARRPKVSYLRGALELMSPSIDGDERSRYLHEIVIAFLDRAGLEYRATGAWLLKNAPDEAGVEPDESYIIGELDKQRPDLAIEVVWTSGGIDKLEVYCRLGVGEVWFWKDATLHFYVLAGDRYELHEHSACVPGFDKQLGYEILTLGPLSAVRRALRERVLHGI